MDPSSPNFLESEHLGSCLKELPVITKLVYLNVGQYLGEGVEQCAKQYLVPLSPSLPPSLISL